jgi:selenocysteine-specific elongation factor
VERHLVVGTAGHIDHGKTALVRALTGVDTDRLEEEKRRGITIDLGFAPLDLGTLRASVVDVPGHEGFIRNMVAGATGVDLALLVVAADEGVMPQTVEHLDILRLLGVARGVVALTKCDLAADPAWRELVAEDVHAAVEARFGTRWPVLEVSATALTGIDALRTALASEAGRVPARERRDRFRLPVDRTFALAGAGTIVTGTVWSGSVAEGDRVLVLPAGVEARVRSVEVHGMRAERAEPGRRAALALVGLAREQAERGAVVVDGEGWRPARAMDVELLMLPGHAALRPRLRVRVHHGTSEVMGRVLAEAPGKGAPTDTASAAPEERSDGWSGAAPVLARLFLEEPLVARAGDRFVVRSYSPVTTIGGGIVVDPWADDLPRERGRRRAPLARLPVAAGERVLLLMRRRRHRGMSVSELEVAAGLTRPVLEAALASAGEGELIRSGDWFVSAAAVSEAADALLAALAPYHAQHPLDPGMPVQAWRGSAGGLRKELVELAERRLERAGAVTREGSAVRLPGFAAGGGAAGRAIRDAILRELEAADAEPPSVAELQAAHAGADVPGALRLLAQQGAAVAVGKDRYYAAEAFARERGRLVAIVRELGEATPAAIRERLGRSRKWLIPLLEHLDREGVTSRRGDIRVLGSGKG